MNSQFRDTPSRRLMLFSSWRLLWLISLELVCVEVGLQGKTGGGFGLDGVGRGRVGKVSTNYGV